MISDDIHTNKHPDTRIHKHLIHIHYTSIFIHVRLYIFFFSIQSKQFDLQTIQPPLPPAIHNDHQFFPVDIYLIITYVV